MRRSHPGALPIIALGPRPPSVHLPGMPTCALPGPSHHAEPCKLSSLSRMSPQPHVTELQRPRSPSRFSPHLAADSPVSSSGRVFRPKMLVFTASAECDFAARSYAFLGDFPFSTNIFCEEGHPHYMVFPGWDRFPYSPLLRRQGGDMA
jgi:hypothetical protein